MLALVAAQHTHTTCNKCLFLLGYYHIALQSTSRRHAHLLLFPIGLHSHHGLSWFFFCKFRNKQFKFLYHELLPFLLMLLIICCHLLPLPLPYPPPPVLGPSQLYLYHARSTQSPHRTLVYTYIHHLPLLPTPSSLSLLIFCLSPKTHLTYYNSHMHPRVECYLLHASSSFSSSSFCLFNIIFLSLVLGSSPTYTFSGPHRAVKPITASFSPLCSSCVISHIHSSHLETADSSVHTQYS